jgi:hypothetical protein
MENNYKKLIGRVYSFDGEAGMIVSNTGNYYFNKKDLLDNKIKEGSTVEFVANTNIFGNNKDLVALFIDSFDYKEDNKLNKGR